MSSRISNPSILQVDLDPYPALKSSSPPPFDILIYNQNVSFFMLNIYYLVQIT